jgi:hypothetical protein
MMRLTRSDLFPLLKRESRIGLKVFWAFLQNMNKRLRVNDRLISEIHQVEERHEESGIFGLSSLDK